MKGHLNCIILYLPRWDVLLVVDDVLAGLCLYFCQHSVNRSSVLLLWRGGHSKKAYCTFLLPLVTSKHSFGFSHTFKYEPPKTVPAILKKCIAKEAQNWTSDTTYFETALIAAKLRVCDVIPSNLKLVRSTKICRWLALFHKVSKMQFFSNWFIHFSIFTAIICKVLSIIWLEIIWLKSSHKQEW